MISSGSRSRLKENEEEVKHAITQESKKQVKGKHTLELCVSLGRYPLLVAYLCPWPWGFLFWSRGEDEK
jgi:glutathionyl-hydroquinone reductase